MTVKNNGFVPTEKLKSPFGKRSTNAAKFKAGFERNYTIPKTKEIFKYKNGLKMKIKDIGFFSEKPDDEALIDLYNVCEIKNTLHYHAPLKINDVKKVAKDILQEGLLHTPIFTVQIQECGTTQVTSGRHRLCALGLIYGPDAEVVVYHEADVPLEVAKRRVVRANDGRNTKALERAHHLILKNSSGANTSHEDQYNKAVTNKSTAVAFALQQIFNDKLLTIDFKTGDFKSKSKNIFCTVGNVKIYIQQALTWYKGLSYEEFFTQLKDAIEFLNFYHDEMMDYDKYEDHVATCMSSKILGAIGMMVNPILDDSEGLMDLATKLAEANISIACDEPGYATVQSQQARQMMKTRLKAFS